MKIVKIIFLAIIFLPVLSAQVNYDRNTVWLLNIPEKVRSLLNRNDIDSIYTISLDNNPSYLRGDFNGDGIMDYAVRIKNRRNGKVRIAICHPELNKVHILAP